jgi:putative NADH-flavin reductase
MKIVVLGGTGRTGIPLIEQAVAAGHEVVALVRTPSKLNITHDCLTVVQGDAMNAVDVNKVITPDVTAVVSVLGPIKGSPTDLLPVAANHVMTAMQNAGVRRLIWMTGAGVSFPQDQPQFFDHVIKFLLKTISPEVLAQSEKAVYAIADSHLDWTIVRGPMLTDTPHSSTYRVGWVGVNTGARLSRADAADFILKQLDGKEYLRLAPMLSN